MTELRRSIAGGAMEHSIEEHAMWAAEGIRLGPKVTVPLRDLGIDVTPSTEPPRTFRVTHVDERSITLEPR